jgi:uncharacterized protein (TIGR02246 family)
MPDRDEAAIAGLADALTTAWNSGDGTAFGRCFTDDADFVNIYAMHFVGRDAIAKQHQMIFDSVYKGSRNAFTVAKTRTLGDGTVLAHIVAKLRVTGGPAAGEIDTLATAVFICDSAGWRITSFHNTREQPPPGPPAPA